MVWDQKSKYVILAVLVAILLVIFIWIFRWLNTKNASNGSLPNTAPALNIPAAAPDLNPTKNTPASTTKKIIPAPVPDPAVKAHASTNYSTPTIKIPVAAPAP